MQTINAATAKHGQISAESSNSRRRRSGRVSRHAQGLVLLAGFVVGQAEPGFAAKMKTETLESVKHATLMVFNAASKSEEGDTALGSGSGYFINSTGLLITNNHVVDPGHGKDPATKWHLLNQYNLLVQTVITDSGTAEEKEYKCELLYTNEAADQALLQALEEGGEKLPTPNYLRFMPESSLRQRLEIVALGFPGGDSRRSSRDKHPIVNVVEGHVLDIPRTPGGRVRMIYTDAELRAGNSGGPVVNNDGRLVGTLTLGVANEERRNYNALVPAALTREFIRAAFTLGKIPTRTDVTPFVDLLSGKSGRTEVPHFERSDEYDILYYDNGDRIYGRITTDSLTWNSSLGKLTVPVESVAYVMSNDEGANLFLEGGNRIRSGEIKSTFQFEPEGGQSTEQEFSAVKVVGFNSSRGKLTPVRDEVVVLDSNVCYLVLQNVDGTVDFSSRAGTIKVPVRDIARFDTDPNGKHVLNLRDGRRLTGKFQPSPIKATIAATQTPVEFDLSGVEWGTIQLVQFNPYDVKGMGLTALLADTNDKVRAIARRLESPDFAGDDAGLADMLKPANVRSLPEAERDRIDLLEAQWLLVKGDFKEASKAFRKSTRAKDPNIAGYATGCSDLLKHYDSYQFRGEPLSDRKTFLAAGSEYASEQIQDARDLLKDAAREQATVRGDYVRRIMAVKKIESSLVGAAVFAGVEAEDELIRLWRAAFDSAQLELRRIDGILEEAKKSRRGSRRADSANFMSQREQDELAKERVETEETAAIYWGKLREYGFRIEDPDLQKHREGHP